MEEKRMKDKGQIENQTTSDFAFGEIPPPHPPTPTPRPSPSKFGGQSHALTRQNRLFSTQYIMYNFVV
jgi:hypothetical protein